MIETKTKSQVLAASAVVGTSGQPGYLHGITLMHAGAAAVAFVSIYDGTSTADTVKWRLYLPNTATASKTISGLNIYCPSGIYSQLSNAVATVEYSGCV